MNTPIVPISRRSLLKAVGVIAFTAGLRAKVAAQAPNAGPVAPTIPSTADGAPPPRALNPQTQWLHDAKWGLFTHYLAHNPSYRVSADFTTSDWNRQVDSFDTKALADQLASLGCPYFFLTIGQGEGYYCSPSEAYARNPLRGPADRLSRRDLIADLAAALKPKGIRLCVYFHSVPRDSELERNLWYQVISEWSRRWGRLVNAWWIDGTLNLPFEAFEPFTKAIKSGNPDALVAYNPGPVGMNRNQLMPSTEHEDYLAGEVDYVLPTCGYRGWDNKPFYPGRNVSGVQLHFLNFLGTWWSTGEPRFPDELVIGWVKHINAHGGAVTWDLPVSRTGRMADSYFRQLTALRKAIS